MKYLFLVVLFLISGTASAEDAFLDYKDVQQNTLTDFENLSSQTVTTMKELGFSDFDYSENSVKLLSDFITEHSPTYSIDTKNKLIGNWGAYLGDAIIKRYGGKWVSIGGGYCVLIGKSYITFPFNKAYKHARYGESEAIYALYVSVSAQNRPLEKQAP